MDPATALGVAAAAAQFLVLAVQVTKALKQYFTDVFEAESQVIELRSEMAILYGVVSQLQFIIETAPHDTNSLSNPSSLHSTFMDAIWILGEMMNKINAVTGANPRLSQKLKWPFKAAEVDEYITKLRRHKATMSLAIQTQQM